MAAEAQAQAQALSRAYASIAARLDAVRKGSEWRVYLLTILSLLLYAVGIYLLVRGALSGSLVSAGSGTVGLLASTWSTRQMYHVWKDGKFLEILKTMLDYAEQLPNEQLRVDLLKEIGKLLVDWVKSEPSLPSLN